MPISRETAPSGLPGSRRATISRLCAAHQRCMIIGPDRSATAAGGHGLFFQFTINPPYR
jgi:hypothetical protein